MPEVRELLIFLNYTMSHAIPIEKIGCLQPDRISRDMQQHLHHTTFCVSFGAISIGSKLILNTKLPQNVMQCKRFIEVMCDECILPPADED